MSNFVLFCGSLGGAGLNQVASKFWDGTKSFLEEYIQSLHMHQKNSNSY